MTKIVKAARKVHFCDSCRGLIMPGESYKNTLRSGSFADRGNFYAFHLNGRLVVPAKCHIGDRHPDYQQKAFRMLRGIFSVMSLPLSESIW